MENDEIICPITELTEFVSPIVIVNKPNGKLPTCLDPQIQNKAILMEHYQLPTFEELTHVLKVFTVLDARFLAN